MRVVVTGGSGALGRAVIEALVKRGDSVAAIGRQPNQDLDNRVFQIAGGDLADGDSASTAVAAAVAALGGMDALIHLVGAFEWLLAEHSPLERWRRLYRENVETALAVIQASLPSMHSGGSILCVGAASAEPAGTGMGPYAAAKSGVARLVEALSSELKTRRVRVNAVLPSIIDTPRNRADMPDADPRDWTSPAAIADVVLFLISDQARAINGALIPVTNNG